MKKKSKKGRVAPIYTIALVWLVYSLLGKPIYSLGRLIVAGVLGLAGYAIIRALFGTPKDPRKKADVRTEGTMRKEAPAPAEKPAQPQQQAQQAPPRPAAPKPAPEPPKPAAPKYPPEVQTVVDEGNKAHQELLRLYASIPNLSVKHKVQELISVSDKIVQDAIDDPNDVAQIKQFLDYYLPTTIKLLNAYDRMGAQGIEGANISGAMQSIDEMLDTAIAAYKKLLDSLFANQAMDIETDIAVMNTLLKREGLSGTGVAGFGL